MEGKSSIKNDEAYPIMDKKEKLMFQKLKSTSGKPEQTYGVIVNAKILRKEKSRIEDNSETRSGGSVDRMIYDLVISHDLIKNTKTLNKQ